MKPFNLKEALSGKPVVTRTGDAVSQLYLFDCDDDLPLMGVLHNEIHSFTKDGKWSTYDTDKRDTDLFMAPEKKSIWVNVYEVMDSLSEEFELSIGKIHGTKESAIISKNKNYIKTIEITNEIEL
jgi:hypothetical protein